MRGRPIVVKIGGSTLGSGDTTLADLVALQRRGVPIVVVHGGGPVISRWMERTGSASHFVRGMRVTDAAALEIVVAALAGLVNKQLVADLWAMGGRALGLSGADGGVLQARTLDPELGYVGDITTVDAEPLQQLLSLGWMPVVAPIAVGAVGPEAAGEATLYNINGDVAAGELAAALEAERLVYLTDVEGVMDASRRTIPRLLPDQARALVEDGIAAGGMIPKLEACLKAAPRVGGAQIVDGRQPHVLLASVEGQSMGTRVG